MAGRTGRAATRPPPPRPPRRPGLRRRSPRSGPRCWSASRRRARRAATRRSRTRSSAGRPCRPGRARRRGRAARRRPGPIRHGRASGPPSAASSSARLARARTGRSSSDVEERRGELRGAVEEGAGIGRAGSGGQDGLGRHRNSKAGWNRPASRPASNDGQGMSSAVSSRSGAGWAPWWARPRRRGGGPGSRYRSSAARKASTVRSPSAAIATVTGVPSGSSTSRPACVPSARRPA